MSNTVKIKRGTNPPTNGDLDNYELGYAKSNKGLYINEDDQIVHLNDTSEIENKIQEVSDKVDSFSGIVVSDTEPQNTGALWIDTSIEEGETTGNGIAKYYDEASGTWLPVAATWG